MRSKVAIVCCSFNLGKYIQATVESILRQTENSKQIIIADGASTDGTLQILRKFSGIEVSSKPDSGYVEGFWNGVSLVNAEYITQCCISDGYVDNEWLQIACRQLDDNPNLDLIWASPISLNIDGTFGDVSFPNFGTEPFPENFQMRKFWMLTGFHFPEGNFVARKEVFLNCFPSLSDYQNVVMEPYLEFSYNFHKEKLNSMRIPRVVNYGRSHDGQLTQQEIENTKKWQFQKRYQVQILDTLREEISEHGVADFLKNFRFYFASYFGVRSRMANTSYMMEVDRITKVFLALQVRFFSCLASISIPRAYRSFV